MIRDLSALLASLSVPSDQIRSEHFETAVAAANLNVHSEPVAAVAAVAVSMVAGNGGRRVSFAASGREGRCAEGRTLLEAAEDAGVVMTSSCRAGVCQACRTRVVDGEVDCRSDMLDPDDRAAGFVLPCVSWPIADCVLDA